MAVAMRTVATAGMRSSLLLRNVRWSDRQKITTRIGIVSVQNLGPNDQPAHQHEYFASASAYRPSAGSSHFTRDGKLRNPMKGNTARPKSAHGEKMKSPRLGLNRVPNPPQSRLPDHVPVTPWKRGCSASSCVWPPASVPKNHRL